MPPTAGCTFSTPPSCRRARPPTSCFASSPAGSLSASTAALPFRQREKSLTPKTKEIVAALRDEQGREVHSEKMLEIDFENGIPVRAGDQFGLGRVVK